MKSISFADDVDQDLRKSKESFVQPAIRASVSHQMNFTKTKPTNKFNDVSGMKKMMEADFDALTLKINSAAKQLKLLIRETDRSGVSKDQVVVDLCKVYCLILC